MKAEGPGIAKARRLSSVLDEALEKSARPALVRGILADLETLLDGFSHLGARLRGDSETGEACLIRRARADEADVLRLTWNHRRISHIGLESLRDLSKIDRLPQVDSSRVVERLVPMIWAHLRAGGTLPPGVQRFASFF